MWTIYKEKRFGYAIWADNEKDKIFIGGKNFNVLIRKIKDYEKFKSKI